MAAKALPSPDTLRQLFSYCPDTGILTSKSGQEIGWLDAESGYQRVFVAGVRYRAHRIIWAIVHGFEPEGLDHINGDRSDNRIANLRPASVAENNQNRAIQRNNKSGITGVTFDSRRDRWRATIKIDGLKRHLGYFAAKEEAAAAYADAKASLHSFHSDVVSR